MNRRAAIAGLACAALLPRAAFAAAPQRIVYDLKRVGDRARTWYAERAVLASRPDVVVAFHFHSVFLYRRLTRELRPGARRGGVLVPQQSLAAEHMVQGREEIARAAKLLGMAIEFVVVPDDPTLAAIRARIEQAGVEVLFVPDELYGLPVIDELIPYLAGARLPALFLSPSYVRKGGLVSITPDEAEGHRMAVEMVARILRGENPATMPVYQATRYRTAINLRTARAMGIVVPPGVLTRADEVVD